MQVFVPASSSYRWDESTFPDRQVEMISCAEVQPLDRQLSHGVFNDSPNATARVRVMRLLDGFLSDAAIPPVELIRIGGIGQVRFRLHHGAHRFYCSVAAGFSHVPAIVYEESEILADSAEALEET